MSTVRKSSYGNGRPSSASASTANRGTASRQANDDASTQTTHYAYQLGDDNAKLYVNEVAIWENEGKFGPYLKILVKGPVPEGTIYVVRKKDA